MRSLRLNPQKHDIELSSHISDFYAEVSYTLADISGEISLTASEAKRMGTWLLNLSKEIEGKNVRSSKRSSKKS